MGDAQNTGFFTTFNQAILPANETLGFRTRLDDIDTGGNFSRVFWVGIDANFDGRLDAFLGADFAGGGAGSLTINRPGTGANNSPSSTTILGASVTYTPTSDNYNYRAVNFTLDGGTTNDVTPGGVDTDYYVSFLIPFQAIVNFLATPTTQNPLGISVTSSSVVRYVMATSTQNNSLNQDLGRISGGIVGPSSSMTWDQLGGFSPPITFSGTIVPEPDIAALLGAFGIICLARRRR